MPTPALNRRTLLGAWLGTAMGAGQSGCMSWPAPTTPMPTRRMAARCAIRSRCVLLPGALSRAEDFVAEGFVADLQAAAPACEIVLADAHLGYFVEGQMLGRLRADVVQPGSPGPRPWLVGISLGGFAALTYAMQHGSEIAGVLALAPYLGRRTLLRDITAAGGPEHWREQPAVSREPHEAIEDDLWRWLARPARPASSTRGDRPDPLGNTGADPPIHLGYGREDRFVDAHRVLQSLLPPGHTHAVAGGHDWPPWRALWQQWLREGWLAAPTGAATACGGTA